MKHLIFFLLIVFSMNAQNQISIDEKTDKPMLVGSCTLEAFQDSNFAWWYNSEFNNYEPNEEILNSLIEKLDNYEIEIIFGTWCSDSKREVPRFIKLLDLLNYDLAKLKMFGVDRNKESPDGDIQSKNIKLVPTFILLENGTEKGRIIETPIKSLEEDLLDIIIN